MIKGENGKALPSTTPIVIWKYFFKNPLRKKRGKEGGGSRIKGEGGETQERFPYLEGRLAIQGKGEKRHDNFDPGIGS